MIAGQKRGSPSHIPRPGGRLCVIGGLLIFLGVLIAGRVTLLLCIIELAVNIIGILLVVGGELVKLQEAVLVLVELLEVLLGVGGGLLVNLCGGELLLLDVFGSVEFFLHVGGDFGEVSLAVLVGVDLVELLLGLLGGIVLRIRVVLLVELVVDLLLGGED